MQEFEMEDRIEERILAHSKKTKRGTFYDDYEEDSIELWDHIEALEEKAEKQQAEIDRLKAVVKVLMLKNGVAEPVKKEA